MNNSQHHIFLTRHEATLERLIHTVDIPAEPIQNAMNYALFPGGKRLRPLLVYFCGTLLGVETQALDIMAAAIELIHCYSLIHDDLPAMDNDDLRRGKPSTHRAFDEATAILVGDGMQAFAIEILLEHLPQTLKPHQIIAITLALTKACGPSGMVSGQSLDLLSLNKSDIRQEKLTQIHHLKTGQLIQACIHMVLHAAHPSSIQAESLRQFASHLGLVFQMQDDYLDRFADPTLLGKDRSSDHVNQKTTFATLYSQAQLMDLISSHYKQANTLLAPFREHADALKNFIADLESRTAGVTLNM